MTGISISAENLGKRFNREWIFRKLDYTFEPGHTYAITGANGSGKSTLLQVLWGQSPPSAGKVSFRQGDSVIPTADIFRHIAIATPYMDVVDEFTLEEQLRFHFRIRRSRENLSLDDMMERMYLTHARHKAIGHFSSGMRQRVKLALAFYTEADIVFLDEPGTNLDQQAFTWYRTQLAALPASALVLVASNNPEEYPTDARQLSIMGYK